MNNDSFDIGPVIIAIALILFMLFVMIVGFNAKKQLDNIPDVSAAEPITQGQSRYVSFYHDDERDVSCWIYSNDYQGGISCISDWDLNHPR